MSRPFRSLRNNSQRGTMLGAYVLLIPIAMGLYCLVLTRIDVSIAQTSREENRTQARFLAESALAVLADRLAQTPRGGAGSRMESDIVGSGRYSIEPIEIAPASHSQKPIRAGLSAGVAPAGPSWRLSGIVEKRGIRYVCEMMVARQQGVPRVQSIAIRLEPIRLVSNIRG